MEDKSGDLEFEGSDVEDAIKQATDALKLTRKDLIVKVVCEEQKGLFGMNGAKSAKIKVKIKKSIKK